MGARVRVDLVVARPRLRIFVEVAAQHRQAAVDRMDVGVLEPWRHRPAAQFDDPRPRPDVPADVAIDPHADDPPIAHRHRVRPAPGGVHGGEAATGEDQVGGAVVGHGSSVASTRVRSSHHRMGRDKGRGQTAAR